MAAMPVRVPSSNDIEVGGSAADDSGMRWFDLPAHMVFHVANAWEEEDGTVKVSRGKSCKVLL
jgi:carotenoid cleavage dioxygenase-like enzyme